MEYNWQSIATCDFYGAITQIKVCNMFPTPDVLVVGETPQSGGTQQNACFHPNWSVPSWQHLNNEACLWKGQFEAWEANEGITLESYLLIEHIGLNI